MDYIYWAGLVIFVCGLLGFSFNWNHLITSLMFLEMMVLSLYFLLSGDLMMGGFNFNTFYYISLAVCEGCLGLSVFVNLVSVSGSDKMDAFNYLKW